MAESTEMTATDNNNSELRQFMERVLKVTPRYNDMFSNGLPGSGAANVGTDPAQNLQKNALLFAHAYREPGIDQQEVVRLAADVEGSLMAAATFEILNEANTIELIDMLHNLLDGRAKT